MASDELPEWVHKTTIDLGPRCEMAGHVLFEALEVATEEHPRQWTEISPEMREAFRDIGTAVVWAVVPGVVEEALTKFVKGRVGASVTTTEIEVEG